MQSRSLAVCVVSAKGRIVQANGRFLEMVELDELPSDFAVGDVLENGTHILGSGAVAAELRTQSGQAVRVTIESIPAGGTDKFLWVLVPQSPADERSHLAFKLLHDSVAQSVAALAMNLFLIEQSGTTNTSPNAAKVLRSSLDLVEQCAKEVRSICTLLQRQSI